MRVPEGLWSRTVDCVMDCAWETLKCGQRACERMAASHLLSTQPYPQLDVIIAAPSYSKHCR